ncbi:MAG: hypothetical protein SWY16_00990 [Cyanobacteriota bacterium]|nr:hypothetical protein [Cyanobacteriota bacterium]
MKQLPETQLETERMLEVQLRLTQLFKKEEAIVKAILDCLYDVGSVNLIEKKIRPQPVQRILKPIARLSKPLFRVLALRWFNSNCPELITDWLYTQVLFEVLTDSPVPPEQLLEVEPVIEPVIEPSPAPIIEPRLEPPNALTQKILAQLETKEIELQRLHGRVRWLAGFSVGAMTIAIGLTALVFGSDIEPGKWLPRGFVERWQVETVSPQP